ncbi:MAG: hypothetical protein ACR2MU_08260 [Gaiellaceae bacterium]
MLAGAALARARDPELVVFEGSGSALPPIETTRRVLVTPVGADVTGYLNAYRVLISDLVVVTMAEDGADTDAIRLLKDVPVVATVLRPRPVSSIAGRSVAFFSTAPESAHATIARHRREAHGATDVTVSGNLSRREQLRRGLERTDVDVWLAEIKAAAIDVVAEAAAERGATVVFADNEVVALPGEPDLDRELERLAEEAVG